MRLIRPAEQRNERRWAVALSLAMVLIGAVAVVLMGTLPGDRVPSVGVLGIAAALALGIGLAWLIRALSSGRSRDHLDDLAHILAPAFDDSYVLILSPRLPGVPRDLAGLLIGPAGVRALVARRWRGHYRVRGRGWEYDTRSRSGWIPCRTNPSYDAQAVADAVSAWTRTAVDDPGVPVVPAIAFPRPWSVIVMEEPDTEILTADNAPWWAQRIGRVQRLDPARVGRVVQAVLDAGEAQSSAVPSHAPRRLG